jgi:hypothetical protein
MSKRIKFVPDIHMEAPAEELYYRVHGSDGFTTVPTRQVRKADGTVGEEPNTPWMARQIAFLLERIADEQFVAGKDGIDGELLRDEVRGIIKRQRDLAPTRGYWEFENDDHAFRLVKATREPKTPMQPAMLVFNFVPFIRAVVDMTTPQAEIELPPVTNGTHAQA